jgi:hypothetical protein
VVELAAERSQAGLYVTETVPVSQFRESHR